jgi:hypothetical protein
VTLRQNPSKKPPAWLRALGREELPATLTVEGRRYQHAKTFKHDFFAATGLYAIVDGDNPPQSPRAGLSPATCEGGESTGPRGHGTSTKVILKVGRRASLLGVPMDWIGRFLGRREGRLLGMAAGVEGVPRFLGIWGRTGIIHDYVEGRPLSRGDRPDDQFFSRLTEMLDQIHALDMAYVDLEKPENILLGDDGRPHLIDFQISMDGTGWLARRWPSRKMRKVLKTADRYHLMKHWRRLRPDQLTPEQIAQSYKAPFYIAWHRAVFRPFTRMRRQILVWLGARTSSKGRSPG